MDIVTWDNEEEGKVVDTDDFTIEDIDEDEEVGTTLPLAIDDDDEEEETGLATKRDKGFFKRGWDWWHEKSSSIAQRKSSLGWEKDREKSAPLSSFITTRKWGNWAGNSSYTNYGFSDDLRKYWKDIDILDDYGQIRLSSMNLKNIGINTPDHIKPDSPMEKDLEVRHDAVFDAPLSRIHIFGNIFKNNDKAKVEDQVNVIDLGLGHLMHVASRIKYGTYLEDPSKLYLDALTNEFKSIANDLTIDHREIILYINYLIESERAERQCMNDFPGYSAYLKLFKEYAYNPNKHPASSVTNKFKNVYLDKANPQVFRGLLYMFIKNIRFPEHIEKETYEEYKPLFESLGKIFVNSPDSPRDSMLKAISVFLVLLKFIDPNDQSLKDMAQAMQEMQEGEGEDGEGGAISKEGLADAAKFAKDLKNAKDASKIAADIKAIKGGVGGSELPVHQDKLQVESFIKQYTQEQISKESACTFNQVRADKSAKARSKDVYSSVMKSTKALSSVLRRHLEFQTAKKAHELKGLREGKIDKLIEGYIGVESVYSQRIEIEQKDPIVGILIDQSGSMSHSVHGLEKFGYSNPSSHYYHNNNCLVAASIAATVIIEALHSNGIRTNVYSFSSNQATKISVIAEGKNAYAQAKENLYSIHPESANRDGQAVKETMKRLVEIQNGEVRRRPIHLFVIVDGWPAASGYNGAAAVKDTRNCVREASKFGYVTGIGIENQGAENVQTIYEHYVVCPDTKELPVKLARVIKKQVKLTSE